MKLGMVIMLLKDTTNWFSHFAAEGHYKFILFKFPMISNKSMVDWSPCEVVVISSDSSSPPPPPCPPPPPQMALQSSADLHLLMYFS
jgi:hypothetical protein